MYIVIGILVGIIILQFIMIWKYQRQVRDICRQLAFLMKHDSNRLINREFDMGGIGTLSDSLNELLELRKKEKQHYREKETLIADTYTNLSHDIRTPLTSLDGYFQLMEECENVEDQKRYLNIIHERIHSLNDMLEELFTFTKLKNESYNLELMPCCINRILKETVFSYYDDWVRMEIQPDIRITEELLHIHGNRQGLNRVIQNVIKNGLDHGEKKISIVLERDHDLAVLRISNQVAHPEQIDIEHVFDRFYKADVARSKTSTGLGLSIAKELVKRMNGEIAAKLEKNEFIVEMSFPSVKIDGGLTSYIIER
jgi:signal transduction histidine kinase